MRCLSLVALALLSACATLVEGTQDNVSLTSQPAGAACTVDRDGERVSALSTPGNFSISKSRRELTVSCTKDGYGPATAQVESSFTGTTLGNILLGGGVGLIVDAASGANSRYPRNVHMEMTELPRPAVAPMAGSPALSPVIETAMASPGV